MRLDMPVYVAGWEVRVKHGTPECFPAINAIIAKFYTEDIPSKMGNKKEPLIRFGLCIGHIYYDNIIEFTYITGVQINEPADESRLPESTKCYTIPAGDYACIKVTSPDAGATIGTAYTRLEQWINESQDWKAAMGEYEVYPNASTNAEMELWRPVRKKDSSKLEQNKQGIASQ
jgi:predicted transcriptional regulator YdeE